MTQVRKLILASFLLVFAIFLPSPAKAWSACCQSCMDQWLTTCWNNCNNDTNCQAGCERNYETCAGNCARSGGGSCPV
jgi:hypothetical protein